MGTRCCELSTPQKKNTPATARLGVRNFEIHWISRGFRISDWISGFHVDFWISKWISGFHVDFWISGFQSGFLDFTWISGFHMDFRISKCISTFWILFEELLFAILKILLINKPSQLYDCCSYLYYLSNFVSLTMVVRYFVDKLFIIIRQMDLSGSYTVLAFLAACVNVLGSKWRMAASLWAGTVLYC